MSRPAGPDCRRRAQASIEESKWPSCRRDRARRVIADLVAVAAAVGLDGVEPLILGLEVDGDAVAVGAGAGEAALVRHPDHRGPVDRRIVLRGGREIGRDDRSEVERLAGRGRDLRRIDEAIAAHPDPVAGLGQIGNDVAADFVGDRHLGEAGAEFGRLRDHPYAGLRPEPAGDDSADVVVVDLDPRRGGRRARRLRNGLGENRRRHGNRQHNDADRRAGMKNVLRAQVSLPRSPRLPNPLFGRHTTTRRPH